MSYSSSMEEDQPLVELLKGYVPFDELEALHKSTGLAWVHVEDFPALNTSPSHNRRLLKIGSL